MSEGKLQLNFENTAIAFSGKSNSDLKKQYWLFRAMNYASLVDLGSKLTTLGFRLHLPVKPFVKDTIYSQFCGGETLEKTLPVIDQLSKFGLKTILDFGVEGKESEEDFERTANEQIRAINFANGNKDVPYVSSKISGLATSRILKKVNSKAALSADEKAEWDRVRQRMRRMCEVAASSDVALYYDAEESWVQDAMDELVDEMMAEFNKKKAVVFNTVQLYRHDRLEFLKKSYEKALSNGYILGMKMVRGAYMEKERVKAAAQGIPSPIHKNKEATDIDYDRAIDFCLENIDGIASCVATHNEYSNQYMAEQIVKRGIDRMHPHIHFSQLLGMSDNISFNLAASGFSVSKYVPYGPVKDVIPYLIRRAEENTSVSGQMSRELSLIKKEIQRRKQ